MTKAKIYTRTGDQGTTSLIGGKRVSKASARLEAYGTIDELNSHMGLLASMVTDDAIRKSIEACQCDLFKIGGILATAPGVSWDGLAMDEALLKELEQKINALVIENEKLKAKIPNIKDRGNVNQDNIKILKRIDALEKYLWKNGVNPNTIK